MQNHLGQEKKEQKAAPLLEGEEGGGGEARQCIENSTCLRPNGRSHLALPQTNALTFQCSTELSSI